MKTNQIMIRDNKLFVQRTKDGYFNASALLKGHEGSKSTRHYRASKSTLEFINQLILEGIETPYLSSNKGVWMHPKLFIDFAMYVSVEFKSIVIDYVLDGLIKSRHDAGDYYNEMCATILDSYVEYFGCKPNPNIYINEANLIKSLVDIKDRNEMTEDELRQITYLQKFNTNLIKKGIGKVSRKKRLSEAAEITI